MHNKRNQSEKSSLMESQMTLIIDILVLLFRTEWNRDLQSSYLLDTDINPICIHYETW